LSVILPELTDYVNDLPCKKPIMKILAVALLAGVSTAMVSHVVNNSRFVSEATKQKVLTAIVCGGYTPNAHARNLASKQNHIFELTLSDLSNPFFPERQTDEKPRLPA
jgi:DNA-binding LacI/PurR family transcriptional regulator